MTVIGCGYPHSGVLQLELIRYFLTLPVGVGLHFQSDLLSIKIHYSFYKLYSLVALRSPKGDTNIPIDTQMVETIKWLLQLLRVDEINFLAALGVALFLHFAGIVWQPLSSHLPDLSSGVYICSVLLLLMRPLSRIPAKRKHLWISLCTESLKMLLALLLLQHVALLYLWDPFSWALSYTLFVQAPNFRLMLAFLLLCYSIYKVLRARLADAVADADAAAAVFGSGNDYIYNPRVEFISQCPYCAEQQLQLLEQQQQDQLYLFGEDCLSLRNVLRKEPPLSCFIQDADVQTAMREHSYADR